MAAKRLLLWLANGVLLAGLYLALSGQTAADEIAAAAIIAMVAAALAEILRRTGERVLHFRRIGWLQLIGGTAFALGRDVMRVGTVLASVRPTQGAFERQPFAEHHTAPAAQAGWRAVLVLASSLTPSSFVIWPLPAHRQLLLHRLPPHASSES